MTATPLEAPVMVAQLLGTAEVTDFKSGLSVWVQETLSIDEYIVWLNVSVRDSFAVDIGETLEKLVTHLFDLLGPLVLL